MDATRCVVFSCKISSRTKLLESGVEIFCSWMCCKEETQLDFFGMSGSKVVTGASEGIGKAYAFALAERGMNVVIISRTKANLDKVAKEIGDTTGRKAKVVVADFTKDDVFDQIEDELKEMNIGVLVNNVGVIVNAVPCRFLETSNLDQSINQLINCNVKALVKMCKIILPGMVNRGTGAIINISSGVASSCVPLYTLYAASKVFVHRFSQALQAEYKEKGIIIQAVAPFSVSTRMTFYQAPGTLVLTPDEFVNTSLQYLLSGDNTYGSISHSLVGWLLQRIPDWILFSECMQNNLQNYIKEALSERQPPNKNNAIRRPVYHCMKD
uniref:Hydroxysteroid (17-beta) dehydrogenase 3 n=1 Tax=Neogobius melanostomus TaxID=47308 RepID=A0A8C6TQY0_9GOBI